MKTENVLVAIPTKGRPWNLNPVLRFANSLGLDVAFFCEPQDREAYEQAQEEPGEMVVIPDNDKGLGYSLCQAKRYAESKGYKAIFKIDDDTRAIGEIQNEVDKVLEPLSMKKVGAVVFPYDFEWYAKTKALFTRKNKRVQTCYIAKLEAFSPREDVSTFEDFWQFLQMRKRGWDTIYCSRHLIKMAKQVGKGSGGMQSHDRARLANNELKKFLQEDPTIKVISKPEKPWKIEPKFTDKRYKSKKI